MNEDEIADIYKYDGIKYNERIGHYQSIYVSRVSDSSIYKKASSGGIIRWLLQKLLTEGNVSSVICVIPGEGGSLFKYAILNSVEDITSATSSIVNLNGLKYCKSLKK